MKSKSLSLFVVLTIIVSMVSGSFADKVPKEVSIDISNESLTVFDEEDKVLIRAEDMKNSEVASQAMNTSITIDSEGVLTVAGSLNDGGVLYKFAGKGPVYSNVGGFAK